MRESVTGGATLGARELALAAMGPTAPSDAEQEATEAINKTDPNKHFTVGLQPGPTRLQ